jgi:Nucleotidyltransferase domain
VDDDVFPRHVADRLGALPGVEAVTLGGSRAEGIHRPDSDWDFSVYYRGHFAPQALRDIGWPGELPTPSYPLPLRERASGIWWDRAESTFGYALANHAPYGRAAQCAGLVAQAASQAAHAVLAARGQWITNEKQLFTRAGLRPVDELIALAQPEPGVLREVADRSRALCADTVKQARATFAPT